MPDFSVIVFASGLGPGVAAAAARCGALGVVDATADQLTDIGPAAAGSLGVRCVVEDWHASLDEVADFAVQFGQRAVAGSPCLVVLPGGGGAGLAEAVKVLRTGGSRVLAEVTSGEEAEIALSAGCAGLVARGNEAGGRVGEETAFILTQRLVRLRRPVWVSGGIGVYSAAAVKAMGAAGVVLGDQLALTRESALTDDIKSFVRRMDGSETLCLGAELGRQWRFAAPIGGPAVAKARILFDELVAASEIDGADRDLAGDRWDAYMARHVGWSLAEGRLLPLGQEAAFAASLADERSTVAGVITAVQASVSAHLDAARRLRPLAPGSTWARTQGTTYPIAQGPMTRVSDQPGFAAAVADAGGLPFLALALLRADAVTDLLGRTAELIGDRPWGVGILGFVPEDVRVEQIDVVRSHRPGFALIAGGSPDQAHELESEGIRTYLHVPSPGLLRLFAEGGSRRFVFEGRECGGHVGPRSSFVLWDTMIRQLIAQLGEDELASCEILFAGGVHDAVSAAAVSAIASPLAARGASIGVLMGSAYLFSEEVVRTGAVTAQFRDQIVACSSTALLESAPGQATRCAHTQFVETFYRERSRLAATGSPVADRHDALERLNLGRLRLATKGLVRGGDQHQSLLPASHETQQSDGLYMAGQVAALRDKATTIADLHAEVSSGATDLINSLKGSPSVREPEIEPARRPDQHLAIIGMACLLPGASDVMAYWSNILRKMDAVSEVPSDRWDIETYFDADVDAADRTYSRWGGFLSEVDFDPLEFGMPPASLRHVESVQLLTLLTAHQALKDAGYPCGAGLPKESTSVILGVGGGVADLGQKYALRAALPMMFGAVPPEVGKRLPEWTEDSFPGILLNVAAGRVANRFDFGGVNFTVDAACASSLAALNAASAELISGSSDVVVVGGADTVQNPFGYLAFSKTHALSPTGRCRPFDETADGIAISEGVAIVVLKRLADAQRDGDRVYAVVRGIGGSSDGRARALTAPRPEGQARALRRAYAAAGMSPATVGLVEAHGTGTVAGDSAEVETLRRVYEEAGARRQSCAIGSVKSMIGHTKCTAGVAGLIKVALALHHRVLPPTISVEQPNRAADFPSTPFYISSELRPWFAAPTPRRAAVSAFGFGGTNFHTVLEENADPDIAAPPGGRSWPAELFVWAGTADAVLTQLADLAAALADGSRPPLPDLAATVCAAAADALANPPTGAVRLALTAASVEDLRALLSAGEATVRAGRSAHPAVRFGSGAAGGQLAFLYPGQGSQYVGMLREPTVYLDELRRAIEQADAVLTDPIEGGIASLIFPAPTFDAESAASNEAALRATTVAQPALAATGIGLTRLLATLGVEPEAYAGHSFGEYVALWAAGAMDDATLFELAEARGKCIQAATHTEAGGMLAVAAGPETVDGLLQDVDGAWVSNRNAPEQTVVSGTEHGLTRAAAVLADHGLDTRRLPVAAAFHSPLVEPAATSLAQILRRARLVAPRRAVYANTTADRYPVDVDATVALLVDHLMRPVRFADQIEAMYEAGVRTFVEVGPRSVLSGLVLATLGDRTHVALALDPGGRGGDEGAAHGGGRAGCRRSYRDPRAVVLRTQHIHSHTWRPSAHVHANGPPRRVARERRRCSASSRA